MGIKDDEMEEKQKLKKVEMARGKCLSYKRTTIVICSINIFIALYVLHSLYTSVYMYPYSGDAQKGKFLLLFMDILFTPFRIFVVFVKKLNVWLIKDGFCHKF